MHELFVPDFETFPRPRGCRCADPVANRQIRKEMSMYGLYLLENGDVLMEDRETILSRIQRHHD